MIHFRKIGIVLAAIPLLGLVLAGPAAAATPSSSHTAFSHRGSTIVPDTGSGCNIATLAPWYNCTTVNGSGLKINFVSGYVHNLAANGPICKWTNPSPNANEPAGDYCSVTWQYEGGNSYEEGGPECVGVHA